MDILYAIFFLLLIRSDIAIGCQKGEVRERGIREDEGEYIVAIHNHYRQLARKGQIDGQPKAEFMLEMKWDPKLAKEAQRIADNCVDEHVEVKDFRFIVGQNLNIWRSVGYVPGFSWWYAIKSWFDEHKTYSFGTKEYNDYTQIVWYATHKVGCGCIHYKRWMGVYEKLYVCNYGPAGNIIGERPYNTTGKVSNMEETKKNYWSFFVK